MVKEELRRRIRRCGVISDHLRQGITCGAYPDIESALDRLDSECPLGNSSNSVISNERMALVNEDIDQALFRLVRATSAWTWLDDHKAVFVLIGPESRGFILHGRVRDKVAFRLEFQRKGHIRFLRFKGDELRERRNDDGSFIATPLQILAGRIKETTTNARIMFESLVRTCDDCGWTHTTFPFMHPGRKIDQALSLLKLHKLMVHSPYTHHSSI